ncbi:MAG: DUF927 domain-containing protein [Holophaga sp.]|nr:DUF927 domain-containing protein [Holophaga sp.]
MSAESERSLLSIPLDALEAPSDATPFKKVPEVTPAFAALPKKTTKAAKPAKEGPDWLKAWQQYDLTELDLHGLTEEMQLHPGSKRSYGQGTKFPSHCILPCEHSDEKDGPDSWGYQEPGKIPSWNCSHSCHKDTLGLRQLLEMAGHDLVSKFAPAMEVEDLPDLPGGHLRRTQVGLFFHSDEDGVPPIHLSSPICVRALIRDKENGTWSLYLRWHDPDGVEHLVPIPRGMLAGDGAELRGILLNAGCHITSSRKGREIFADYLNQVRVKARGRSVGKIGWNGNLFVLPQETIGEDAGEMVVFQGARRTEHTFRIAGELPDWQERIGVKCVGNSRLILAVSAGFAGPLLNPMGMEPGGINVQGGSSTGKSTTLFTAGSVWGGGDARMGFVKSWRGTANGLEGTALAHNDALLLLDEMGQVDAAQAGEIAYMLANGQQKARARQDGSARPMETWSLFFLSSGEISLADKMLEAGRQAKVGQEVRLVDIPADAGKGLGIFENLHGAEDGAHFADQLRNASLACYGTPSRAFLKSLVEQEDRFKPYLKEQMAIFMKANCPKGADGQVQRVAGRFALIAAAGELATKLGILPWPAGEAHRGVGICFNAWLEGRGGSGPAEIQKGVAQVLRFLQTYGSSRFEDVWEENSTFRPIKRVGYRKLVDRELVDGKRVGGRYEYYLFTDAFKTEACIGFDSRRIAKELLKTGIITGDGGKTSRSIKIPGQCSQRVYCFNRLPKGLKVDEPGDEAPDF